MESVRFKVEKWEHKFPSGFSPTALPIPYFTYRVLRSANDNKKIGLQFKWLFVINDSIINILEYGALDDYLTNDIMSVNAAEIQATIRLSHLKFRKEFDRRKVDVGMVFIIPNYKEDDIDYQQIVQFLQS